MLTSTETPEDRGLLHNDKSEGTSWKRGKKKNEIGEMKGK
jgi:hypothetical protein